MEVIEGRVQIDDVDEFLETLHEVGDRYGCVIQAFDARYIASREHIERAVDLANRSFGRGENVADDPGVELLLYAAGRRQIDQAMQMGVKVGECDVVVVIDGDNESEACTAVRTRVTSEPALDNVGDTCVKEFFEISDDELGVTDGTVADIVVERVALLDVEK